MRGRAMRPATHVWADSPARLASAGTYAMAWCSSGKSRFPGQGTMTLRKSRDGHFKLRDTGTSKLLAKSGTDVCVDGIALLQKPYKVCGPDDLSIGGAVPK